MNIINSLLLLVVLTAGGCIKNEDCIYKLRIQNNSSDTVIYSLRMTLAVNPDMCKLTNRETLSPGQSTEENLNFTCWEDELRIRGFEFYIVHKDSLNEGNFYDCDSINFFNDVLRHYKFDESDVDSLKNVNWTIRFP